MLKNSQTYFKNLVVDTPQNFWIMFGNFFIIMHKKVNGKQALVKKNMTKTPLQIQGFNTLLRLNSYFLLTVAWIGCLSPRL